MGSRGALLAADYNDDPGNHGHPAYSLALQRAVFRVARKLGWQIAIHAIGDEANRIAVAWVESDAREQTNRLPVRVEHAQLLHGEDFVRFAKSGAIASMQPIHVADDHSWAVARVGNERAKNAYAWGKHARAGAKLSFGSDAPVSDMNPAYGVYVALTRKDLTGNPPGGWYPENSLLLPETVEAYTAGAARAVGEEKSGSLLPGKQFSVTVFEKDCRNQTAECWLSVRAHALP
jgi:predicted amidohydrolase YtcJ